MTAAKAFREILEEKIAEFDDRSSFNSTLDSKFELGRTAVPYFNTEDLLTLLNRSHPFTKQTRKQGHKNQAYITHRDTLNPKNIKLLKPPNPPQPAPKSKDPRFMVTKLSVASQLTLDFMGFNTKLKDISLKELQSLYRKRARELHPDLNPDQDGTSFAELKTAAEAVFNELKQLIGSCDT